VALVSTAICMMNLRVSTRMCDGRRCDDDLDSQMEEWILNNGISSRDQTESIISISNNNE